MSKITGNAETIRKFQDLQRRLTTVGFYKGPIDQDWGEGTVAALDQLFAKAGFPNAKPEPAATWLDASTIRWPLYHDGRDYRWLANVEGLPKLTIAAGMLLRTAEVSGSGDNPVIMGWKRELAAIGKKVEGFTSDAVPWCGLGMGKIALLAGYEDEIPTYPLWALNWGDFGEKAKQPCLGSILTFVRDGGGHVGEYIAEDSSAYHVIGCNQGNTVRIDRIAKSRLKEVREPAYKIRPAGARPFIVTAHGQLSTNER